MPLSKELTDAILCRRPLITPVDIQECTVVNVLSYNVLSYKGAGRPGAGGGTARLLPGGA